MPSSKKRVNLTIDEKTYSVLQTLSRRTQQKISTVSLKLIQQALELQEDIYFSKLADERLSKKQKRVPHGKAWK